MKVFLILVCMVSIAYASPTASPRSGPYLGVQPGTRDEAPNTNLKEVPTTTNDVTWVGFDMRAPGGRVFIQTNQPAKYQVLPTVPTRVKLEIQESALNWKNDGHHLDTRFFPAVVNSVKATPSDSGTSVTVEIKLKHAAAYDLRQEGNYLFIDFVRGNH